MNWREYEKTTLAKMQGRRFRTKRALQNGYLRVAEGTVVTVTGKRKGWDMETEPCVHCGVQVFIKRVPPTDIEEIDEALS